MKTRSRFVLKICLFIIGVTIGQTTYANPICEIVEDGAINRFKIIVRGQDGVALSGPDYTQEVTTTEEAGEGDATIVIESRPHRTYSGLNAREAGVILDNLVEGQTCDRGSNTPEISCRMMYDSRETSYYLVFRNNADQELRHQIDFGDFNSEGLSLGVGSIGSVYGALLGNYTEFTQQALNSAMERGECSAISVNEDVTCEITRVESPGYVFGFLATPYNPYFQTGISGGPYSSFTPGFNGGINQNASSPYQTRTGALVSYPQYGVNLVNRRTGERRSVFIGHTSYNQAREHFIGPFLKGGVCSEVSGLTNIPSCDIQASGTSEYTSYMLTIDGESVIQGFDSLTEAREVMQRLVENESCVAGNENIDPLPREGRRDERRNPLPNEHEPASARGSEVQSE